MRYFPDRPERTLPERIDLKKSRLGFSWKRDFCLRSSEKAKMQVGEIPRYLPLSSATAVSCLAVADYTPKGSSQTV
jgi:hypothetical protein